MLSAALLGGDAVHVVLYIVHVRQFFVFDDLVLGKLVILLELFEKQSPTLRR